MAFIRDSVQDMLKFGLGVQFPLNIFLIFTRGTSSSRYFEKCILFPIAKTADEAKKARVSLYEV